MRHDVDHRAVRLSRIEAPDAPRPIPERIDELESPDVHVEHATIRAGLRSHVGDDAPDAHRGPSAVVVYISMAAENSFDIVCKVDMQEVTNALDQTRREIETRYDLKGSRTEVKLDNTHTTLLAPDEMKVKAVVDILQSKLHRRGVPLKALDYGAVESAAGGALRQKIAIQQGIPIEKAREIVRLIKDSKVRV